MESRLEISPIFAYLPNGIIREIVAYTGATYKKRNGKYIGQIPKSDPRLVLLLKIPKKQIHVNDHLVSNPNCKYFSSWVSLTRIGERHYKHPRVRLAVFGVTYINDPIVGNIETIEYECRICDSNIVSNVSDFYVIMIVIFQQNTPWFSITILKKLIFIWHFG